MAISIQFLGNQRSITGTPSIEIPVTGEMRVCDVFEYVKHSYPALHLQESETIIIVNQEMALPDQIVRDNDIISFLPFIHGG